MSIYSTALNQTSIIAIFGNQSIGRVARAGGTLSVLPAALHNASTKLQINVLQMWEGWRGGSNEGWRGRSAFTSQTVFSKSFCISRFPHKFVNLSFIISNVENRLVLELTLANNFMRELTFAKQHKHCLGDQLEGEA